MKREQAAGHLAALFTILIWGTTFISTKLLLAAFQPVEILFFRFAIGFFALLAAHPHPLRGLSRRQEAVFAAAGLCGIALYYLLENIALTLTSASNVGVILSVAPFFTALLERFGAARTRLRPGFAAGFALAMAGIGLISWGGARLALNPAGDLLALLAAFVWACYSLLCRAIAGFGLPVVDTTRRTFFYGLCWMAPALALFGFGPDMARFADPVCLFNILYLGLGACALCFVSWNFAVKALGAVQTSVYIYLVPVITVAASALILREPLTAATLLGTALTLAGLFLSQAKSERK